MRTEHRIARRANAAYAIARSCARKYGPNSRQARDAEALFQAWSRVEEAAMAADQLQAAQKRQGQ